MVTVIEELVSLVLHNNDPVKLLAVKTELPQLSETFTVGTTGTSLGADVPLPGKLVHPLTAVCVTVYVEASVTVIDEVVAPLLHNNEPVKFSAVNIELPQLFVTSTVGAEGTASGEEVPLATGLTHPFTV